MVYRTNCPQFKRVKCTGGTAICFSFDTSLRSNALENIWKWKIQEILFVSEDMYYHYGFGALLNIYAFIHQVLKGNIKNTKNILWL